MVWVVQFAIVAGLLVAAALIFVGLELRSLRADRRILDAERKDFDAKRARLDGQTAAALLESARRLDASERERRALTVELLESLRSMFGRQDEAMRELVEEVRDLWRSGVVPLTPPPMPDVDETRDDAPSTRRAIPPPPETARAERRETP